MKIYPLFSLDHYQRNPYAVGYYLGLTFATDRPIIKSILFSSDAFTLDGRVCLNITLFRTYMKRSLVFHNGHVAQGVQMHNKLFVICLANLYFPI